MEKPNEMKSGVKDGGDGDFYAKQNLDSLSLATEGCSVEDPSGPMTRNPTTNETDLLKIYLDTLSKKEYASYLIAKSHLGTSFQLEKSNGYLQWITTQVLRSKTLC